MKVRKLESDVLCRVDIACEGSEIEMTGKSGHSKLRNWPVKKITYQNIRSSILFLISPI